MNHFWKWLYALYVGFRKAIGWYKVREIWIANAPINQESEIHVDMTNVEISISSRHEFEHLLNLQGRINWNDCWMERVLYVGHLGDWPTNRDLMPGALFHEGVNLNTKETVDSSFYLPSEFLHMPDNQSGEIHLYWQDVGEVPTLCVIHLFENVEDAKLSYQIKLEQIQRECDQLSKMNDPCQVYHHS